MRDPERIDHILDKLKIVWAKQPDTRLFQLLINILTIHDLKYRGSTSALFYYCEDDVLERVLDEELNINECNKTTENPPDV
jgi:uncharacterized protein YihD (DUF1040 family)